MLLNPCFNFQFSMFKPLFSGLLDSTKKKEKVVLGLVLSSVVIVILGLVLALYLLLRRRKRLLMQGNFYLVMRISSLVAIFPYSSAIMSRKPDISFIQCVHMFLT